jgi:hypothetical protein
MFKKTKLYVGVSLIVQAVSAVFMFFILLGKKKSLAGAFMALATVCGAAGAYLLYDCKKDEEQLSFSCLDYAEDYDCCDCDCCDSDSETGKDTDEQ